jgi:3-hydroxyacyl-[acyl-carrier-protein] dehydratase
MWMAGSIVFSQWKAGYLPDSIKKYTKMYEELISQLPYKSSFLFVDNITLLNKDEVIGDFTLQKDAFYYEDHFVGNPVTPGVIITEIMAQIGVVVLGVYLLSQEPHGFEVSGEGALYPLLTSTEVAFHKIVFPGEKVTVISRKQYFRFGKLKCQVEMRDMAGNLIAKGLFSGFIKHADKINKGQ